MTFSYLTIKLTYQIDITMEKFTTHVIKEEQLRNLGLIINHNYLKGKKLLIIQIFSHKNPVKCLSIL